jgi:hypothetical protein
MLVTSDYLGNVATSMTVTHPNTKVYSMDTQRRPVMQPKDLTSVLKGAKPGEWLALSMDRTTILARGETPQAASKNANDAGHSKFVLFHVPLPSVGIAASIS